MVRAVVEALKGKEGIHPSSTGKRRRVRGKERHSAADKEAKEVSLVGEST